MALETKAVVSSQGDVTIRFSFESTNKSIVDFWEENNLFVTSPEEKFSQLIERFPLAASLTSLHTWTQAFGALRHSRVIGVVLLAGPRVGLAGEETRHAYIDSGL